MTFRTVSHALSYYYANLPRVQGWRALPLEPREVDCGGDRRRLEDLRCTLLDIAAAMKRLRVSERTVLEAVYRDKLPLLGDETVEPVIEGVRERLKHRFPGGALWLASNGAVRRVRVFDKRFIIRVRRHAERRIEERLERRGLLS